MKKYLLLVITLALFLPNAGFAQKFPVDTIYFSGPTTNRINFVFLSDGYRASELDKFKTDVNTAFAYFFSKVPLSNYKGYFNIFAIRVPSNESGASHPRNANDCPDAASHPYAKVDNYFGSTFDSYGVHRSIVAKNTTKIQNVLITNFGEYDVVYVLVNSPYYGGTGGTFATSTTGPNFAEVILHETGHSMAKVSDEYGGNCTYKSLLGTNVTLETVSSKIPWKSWLSDTIPLPTPAIQKFDKIVGLFEGAYYCDDGWYRSQLNCKMRSLNVEFCKVCTQIIIEKIHDFVNPIESYSPSQQSWSLADTTIKFSISLALPNPNTMKITWTLDGSEIGAGNSQNFNFKTNVMTKGYHKVNANIIDTNIMTRAIDHSTKHSYTVQWDIIKTNTGVEIENRSFDSKLSVYPNPIGETLNIDYELSIDASVKFDICDIQGNIIKSFGETIQSSGSHRISEPLSGLNMPSGAYFVRMFVNGTLVVKELVK